MKNYDEVLPKNERATMFGASKEKMSNKKCNSH